MRPSVVVVLCVGLSACAAPAGPSPPTVTVTVTEATPLADSLVEDRALLIVAEEEFWINTTSHERIDARFGDHCAVGQWFNSTYPPHVHIIDWQDREPPPTPVDAILLLEYNRTSIIRDSPRFLTAGGSSLTQLLRSPNGTFEVRSTFNQSLVLARVDVANGTQVRIGEAKLDRLYATWTGRFEQVVRDGRDEWNLVEVLRIRYQYPGADVALRTAPGYCA
ncbi:MAG: hypothetical protein HYT80_01035 [Euryarchaeota archaeon]|nr:hypothetical protein [Euryarchaeota archaeon]